MHKYLIFTFIVVTLLASCREGDGGGANSDTNIGWVEISSYSIQLNSDGVPYAYVDGKAFNNPSYSSSPYSGLCSLLCRYDDANPGVDVSLINQTNHLTSAASSRYGTLTNWWHLWSGTIPLAAGMNTVVVNANDPAGNHGTDSVNIEYLPPAPTNISTNSGNAQITIEWEDISGAESYNIYWLKDTQGVTKTSGQKITNVFSPHVHSVLMNGSTYYYVLTSVFAGIESSESSEISAVSGAPERPNSVIANTLDGDVVITWDDVDTATTYNLYWANEPGVTKTTGIKINGVSSPYIHTGLAGIPYYYIVTAGNRYGESSESLEVTAMPPLPPPAPTGINATAYYDQNFYVIYVRWDSVPAVNDYNLYRCLSMRVISVDPPERRCEGGLEKIYTGIGTLYSDFDIYPGSAGGYSVTAVNDFGESDFSEDIGVGAVGN